MTLKLVMLTDAKQDLREAAEWYDKQSEGRGKLFLDAVNDKFDFLLRNPQIHAVVHRNARLAQLHPYPYVIVYSTEPERLMVFAVVHTSRDPALWRHRLL